MPVDFYEDLKSAYEAFDQKKYSKTLEILNELSPETNEVILLKGATYFQQKDSEKAIENFQKIDSQTSENDEAKWYLALSYLQKNDIENARPILESIIQKKTWQHQKADEILRELE